MKKHVLDATSRWGFDFTADQPVRSPEAKYIWERVPPLDDAEPQMGSSNSSSGPVPVMTLSSAAHIRTIEVVALSPSSTSSTLSSANSSLVSSPSTSLCNSDLETDMDVSAVVNGDLNSNDGGAAAKRMVQKKMTGEFCLYFGEQLYYADQEDRGGRVCTWGTTRGCDNELGRLFR